MSNGLDSAGFGVFRIGERLIGVPFNNLAEVCVVPAVSKLMEPEGALLGAFDLRGTLLPLIDMEAFCGVSQRGRRPDKAAVLQDQGRITAIALDEIISLTEAQPTRTQRGAPDKGSALPHGDDANLNRVFTSGFVLDGKVVNCLDAPAFLARPDVPSIANTRAAKRSFDSARGSKALIFSSGGVHFGVDAVHISATVPRKPIDTSEIGGDGGICMGFVEHHGWKIPAVHTNRVLGIGRFTDPRDAEVVLLRFPDRRLLGLAVDATERLSWVPGDRLQPASDLIAGLGLLPEVFVSEDGEQVFMVDFDALSARPDLRTLAELAARLGGQEAARLDASQDADGAVRESERYLIFDAGGKMAVRAHQIARILPMPRDIVPPGNMPPSVRGFFLAGGRSVPLVALPGTAPGGDGEGFVLLVSADGKDVGFTADRICSMRTSEWRIAGTGAGPDTRDMVQVRDRGETAILPVADLIELARDLSGTRRAAAPPAARRTQPGEAPPPANAQTGSAGCAGPTHAAG